MYLPFLKYLIPPVLSLYQPLIVVFFFVVVDVVFFVDVVAALAVSVNVGTVVMSIAQRQNASIFFIFFMLNMTSLKNLFSIQYRGGFSQAIV